MGTHPQRAVGSRVDVHTNQQVVTTLGIQVGTFPNERKPALGAVLLEYGFILSGDISMKRILSRSTLGKRSRRA